MPEAYKLVIENSDILESLNNFFKKLLREKVLDSLFHVVLVKRFAFDVELLMVAHHIGYKISDAPIEINFGREQRIGRIRVIDILNTYWDTLAIFYRMYLRRYYIKRLSGKYKR